VAAENQLARNRDVEKMNHDSKLKALERKAIKECGFQSNEDAIIELIHQQGDLMTKKRKKSNRQIVLVLIKPYNPAKKRKKLIRALASLEPVKKSILEQKTGTGDIKSLIRDTNKEFFKKNGIQFTIKSCRDSGLKGSYRLKIPPSLIKNNA